MHSEQKQWEQWEINMYDWGKRSWLITFMQEWGQAVSTVSRKSLFEKHSMHAMYRSLYHNTDIRKQHHNAYAVSRSLSKYLANNSWVNFPIISWNRTLRLQAIVSGRNWFYTWDHTSEHVYKELHVLFWMGLCLKHIIVICRDTRLGGWGHFGCRPPY